MNPTLKAVLLHCTDDADVARVAAEARQRALLARQLPTALTPAEAEAVSGGLRALNPGNPPVGNSGGSPRPPLPLPLPFPLPGPIIGYPFPPITIGMVGALPGVVR